MKYIIPILLLFVLLIPKQENKVTIPENSIRFRIIANSNSIEDQQTKMLIVNELSKTLFKELEGVHNKEEAEQIITKNTDLIETTISKYTPNYNVSFGSNYFPEKEYLGTKYNAGKYESLVINLDESAGDNFWCVLFPPLCLLEAQEAETDTIEYRSLVKDIIDNI